jgi:hypothetical protein
MSSCPMTFASLFGTIPSSASHVPYAIGYRVDLSGQLRLMRIDARAIAKAVRRQRAA